MNSMQELVWASAYGTTFAMERVKNSQDTAHRRAKGVADEARDRYLREKHLAK